jgi:hypothetical protein
MPSLGTPPSNKGGHEMSERKPELASLIRAGQTAFRPEPSDRDRVLQSLTRTLGEGALLGGRHPAASAKSAAMRLPVRGWILSGLGALTVGAGVVVAAHPWRATTSRAASVIPAPEPAPSASAPALPIADDPGPPRVEGAATSPRPATRASFASTPSDSLPEEVRLLSRAEQQLSAGHADEALRTLSEHERRFPSGALAEERLAARVQSLCALGRVAEAKADLTKLARAHPQSPHLDRARKFCGLESP